jgi:hypothetical protein
LGNSLFFPSLWGYAFVILLMGGNQTPRQLYNRLLAQNLCEAFRRRNMDGLYCETKEEALQAALGLLDKETLVSCGGSATLHEIGLVQALRAGGYRFLDPFAPQTGKKKEEITRKALGAEYYFMGCNAIAQSGELVNADGIGNRLAALAFGPKNVVVVAGMNKVEPTLQAAIRRVQTRAAQMILLQFKPDFTDFDSLAAAAEGACGHLAVTRMPAVKGRIRVLLVGESLGY